MTAPQQQPQGQPAGVAQDQSLLRGPVTGRQKTITEDTAAFLGVPPGKVFDVLRGVWTTSKGQPPLSNAELLVGMAIVARYGLDPFAREIYVTRDKKGRLMTIVGVDGFIRVLDRTDHYDGFEQELIFDDKQRDVIVKVITRIYSKLRSHPATYEAFAADYVKLGGFMAGQIPGHMLRIFSLKHAARLFVPLGSVVTEEEAKWMGGDAVPAEPVTSLDDLTDKLTEPTIVPTPSTPGESATEAAGRRLENCKKAARQAGSNLATKIETEQLEKIEYPEPTPEDVAADQAIRCDEFAAEFAKSSTATRVSDLSVAVVNAVAAGELTEDQAGELYELANAAKDRLSKV